MKNSTVSPANNFPDFLDEPADVVARRLLGCVLARELDGVTVQARIVETESYDQTDAASHSARGQTPRNSVMFGPSGRLYVYFTYGMHYCCNVVTGRAGEGSAVLIRAVEPLDHAEVCAMRRKRTGVDMTNGPAKLCQALAIDRSLNGHDLRRAPLQLHLGEPIADHEIVQTTRIGISQARDELRRWYIAGNPYVSARK